MVDLDVWELSHSVRAIEVDLVSSSLFLALKELFLEHPILLLLLCEVSGHSSLRYNPDALSLRLLRLVDILILLEEFSYIALSRALLCLRRDEYIIAISILGTGGTS